MPTTGPKSEEQMKVGPLAEQDSLLDSYRKRILPAVNAEKYKKHEAMEDKIHGIVASRKQIKNPEMKPAEISKKPEKKQISQKKVFVK